MMPTETHETTLAAPPLSAPASLARRTARAIGYVLEDAWSAAPFALAVVVAAGGLAGYRVVGGGNAKPAPVPPPPAPPICPAPEKKPPDNAAKWDVASFDGAAWGD